MLGKVLERVRRMELCFDMLRKTMTENPRAFLDDDSVKAMLKELMLYYDGGQWLEDYKLDEAGLIPQDMKRGVLAEDSVYDLLDEIRRLEAQHQ